VILIGVLLDQQLVLYRKRHAAQAGRRESSDPAFGAVAE
jgi:hypothetical protein